eukprot:5873321-Pyramimonas_sp.AAC.1
MLHFDTGGAEGYSAGIALGAPAAQRSSVCAFGGRLRRRGKQLRHRASSVAPARVFSETHRALLLPSCTLGS